MAKNGTFKAYETVAVKVDYEFKLGAPESENPTVNIRGIFNPHKGTFHLETIKPLEMALTLDHFDTLGQGLAAMVEVLKKDPYYVAVNVAVKKNG